MISELWEKVKIFVVDSMIGDIEFAYRLFDIPDFWDAVEKKL